MDFSSKKIYIAPHTPRTTMFARELQEKYTSMEFMGFIDKTKQADNIFKIEELAQQEYDYILILSLNHFSAIYKDYTKLISKKRLIHVDVKNENYIYNNWKNITLEHLRKTPQLLRENFLEKLSRTIDFFKIKRSTYIFLSQSFVGTNNKMLYLSMHERGLDVVMLTDNQAQLKILKEHQLPCANLNASLAYYHLARAKVVIQDQGNSNSFLKFLSTKQKTLQIWHGIPLKQLNTLSDVEYDYFTSPSHYVNRTTLNAVVPSREQFETGYPRNDLLLKEHTQNDLIFCDRELYELSKNEKTVVYMPTHRESSSKIPLDFQALNATMKNLNTHFIIKLHPFVMRFYEDIKNSNEYSHIHFHSIEGDIYPLLKYTDILVTDYSSVYFDFLLLDRPIVFFAYDYEEYSSNMGGFLYDYEENAPGEKVHTQEELFTSLSGLCKTDTLYLPQRKSVLRKFFTSTDFLSSNRIIKEIFHEL